MPWNTSGACRRLQADHRAVDEGSLNSPLQMPVSLLISTAQSAVIGDEMTHQWHVGRLLSVFFYLGIFLIFAFASGLFRKTLRISQRLIGIAIFVVVVIVFSLVYPYISDPLDSMMDFLATLRFPTAVLVLAAGYGAHKFKKANKRLYGQVEVVFGIASSFFVAEQPTLTNTLAKWTAAVGAAYVIARGLNNISEAEAGK